MSDLTFQTYALPDVPQGVRVTLVGTVDKATADTLRATLLTLLSVGFRRIALDFSKLEAIATDGLVGMRDVGLHVRDTGGEVILCGLPAIAAADVRDRDLTPAFVVAATLKDGLNILAEAQVRPVDDLEDDDGNVAEFFIGHESNDAAEAGEEEAEAVPVPDDADGATSEVALDLRASCDTVNIAELIGVAERDGLWSPPEVSCESSSSVDYTSDSGVEAVDPVPVGAAEPVSPPPRTRARTDRMEESSSGLSTPRTGAPVSVPGVSSRPRRNGGERTVSRNREAADRARAAAGLASDMPGRTTAAGVADTDRREHNLKAMVTLLATVPPANRLWRKVLAYAGKDPHTQVPCLNLVLAPIGIGENAPDAFVVSDANPYVTVVPRLSGATTVPQRLSIDVTTGAGEIVFRIQPNDEVSGHEPDEPPHHRLEIWYGPTLVRTIRTPNPLAG